MSTAQDYPIDFPAIVVARELAVATRRTEQVISHQHLGLVFVLSSVNAAVTLLEAGDTANALDCLRRAYANGCRGMNNLPALQT